MTQPDGPTEYPANWPGATPQRSEPPSVAVELAIRVTWRRSTTTLYNNCWTARVAEVCADMLNTTAASMQSARQLIAAVKDLGITPPKPLNDIIAGFDVLATHAAQPDPAQTIIDAAADGELTAEHLDELINEAATAQLLNEYRGPLCQRLEGRFVERFHKALCDGAADEILDGLRPDFDAAAQALDAATAAVDINVDPRQLAEHGHTRRTGSVAQHPTRRADAGRHLDNGPPVRPPLDGLGCPRACRKASTRAASPTKP